MKTLIKGFDVNEVTKVPTPIPQSIMNWFNDNTLIYSEFTNTVGCYSPVGQADLYLAAPMMHPNLAPGESKETHRVTLLRKLAVLDKESGKWKIYNNVIIESTVKVTLRPGTGNSPWDFNSEFNLHADMTIRGDVEHDGEGFDIDELFYEMFPAGK